MAQSSLQQPRKPCFTCKNQVFFAERLEINSCLYHRSCFKCARCHSVLNIGNFYETENENEYCCETCPDEEKNSIESSDVSSLVKQFEDKISLNVLKQSLSDEEKSANLIIQSQEGNDTQTSILSAVQDESSTNINDNDSESDSDNEITNDNIQSDKIDELEIKEEIVENEENEHIPIEKVEEPSPLENINDDSEIIEENTPIIVESETIEIQDETNVDKKLRPSLNPFDEDDDEEDEIPQLPQIQYKKSLNPFGDEDSDEENASLSDFQPISR